MIWTLILIAACSKAPDYKYPSSSNDGPLSERSTSSSEQALKNYYQLSCKLSLKHEGNQIEDIEDLEEMIFEDADQDTLIKIIPYQSHRGPFIFAFKMDLPLNKQLTNSENVEFMFRKGKRDILNNGDIHNVEEYTPFTIKKNQTLLIYESEPFEMESRLVSERVTCTLFTDIL